MSVLTRIGNRMSELVSRPDEPSLSRFRQEIDKSIDRMWRSFWNEPLPTALMGSDDSVWPAIDVTEDDQAITLTVDVPGLEAKDLEVELSGDVLSVRGTRQEQTNSKNGGQTRHERFIGSFARSLTLPSYVDGAKVEARYDKGVLTITVPKIPGKAPQPKKVPISTC